jgi:CRP-like cAMP-binding protein
MPVDLPLRKRLEIPD